MGWICERHCADLRVRLVLCSKSNRLKHLQSPGVLRRLQRSSTDLRDSHCLRLELEASRITQDEVFSLRDLQCTKVHSLVCVSQLVGANLAVPRAADREYSHKADQRLATRYSDPQLMFGDAEWLEFYAGAHNLHTRVWICLNMQSALTWKRLCLHIVASQNWGPVALESHPTRRLT